MANEKRLIDLDRLIRSLKAMASEYDAVSLHGIINSLKEWPTLDAIEVDDMKSFAEDVVYQFGYYCQNKGRLHITHGGLSTLEWAFDILGWENPHPVPECECEIDGCHEHATCGSPTKDGYKRMCGKHLAKMGRRE